MASLIPVSVGNSVKLNTEEYKKLSPSAIEKVEKCCLVLLQLAYSVHDAQGCNFFRQVILRKIWIRLLSSPVWGVRGGFQLEGNRKLDFVPLLRECVEKKFVSGVGSVHAHIIKTGFAQDSFLVTSLVNVYCKNGMMENARKLFEDLPTRNVVTWTSLVSGYVHNSQPERGIGVFKEMLEAGLYPTNYTFGTVLKACSYLLDIKAGKQIHGCIVKSGYEHDVSTGNAICSLYSRCQKLDMAIRAFHRINDKDVISWTAAISACGDNGNSSLGLNIFVQMLTDGIQPNEITFTTVIGLCCAMHALGLGSQIQSLSIKLGYSSDLPVANSFMYLYLTNGCISEAKQLFYGMDIVTLVAWNALIAGHADIISKVEDNVSAYAFGIEALKLFQQMNRSGVRADSYTYSSVLTICSSIVALEQGEQIHAQAIKTGFLSDVVLSTALVNMYNKCGSIHRSCKVFSEMSSRTLISWTSMISALAQHGYSQQALDVFEDIRSLGVQPNKITFVGVLTACSQAGLVNQAIAYYDMMTKTYKINPVVDHVACLVNMFVRLGRIKEAFDVIKNANMEPNEFILSILIAGCRTHDKLELGFQAADQLLELKPKDRETYILLLTMYLSAGKWKDVSRVRKLMKDEKIDKITDWSWITIRNKVHSFKVTSKKLQGRGSCFLDELVDKCRAYGYQEVIDEKSEGSASHHSEKAAIAYALIATSSSLRSIRIIKSIGMCRDCHNFMKTVSLLTSKVIIIRDTKRLHRFSQGQCSCGDSGALV